MIYHVTGEKYYQLHDLPLAKAPSVAEALFLHFPFEDPLEILRWEFVPFEIGATTFCIEFDAQGQNEQLLQLLFTVEFSDTTAKSTCYEQVN